MVSYYPFLHSVFLGWSRFNRFRPRPFGSLKPVLHFWIFLACSSSDGTHFTQSSPYLDESEQKLWDFSVIIHRLSVIGHLNLGGVAWCLKQSVNLQCHVQPRRTNVEINIPSFFHQEAKFKTHFYISGDFDKMQLVQQVLHLHVHDISKHGGNRASMSLNTTKVPTSC